jgi:hypothetical protein
VAGLSPEQEARLHRLLTNELRRAWEEAVGAGGRPAALRETVDRRRRRLESWFLPTDDLHDRGDDPVDDRRVGE